MTTAQELAERIDDMTAEEMRHIARKLTTYADIYTGDKEARSMARRCADVADVLDAASRQGGWAEAIEAAAKVVWGITFEHGSSAFCTLEARHQIQNAIIALSQSPPAQEGIEAVANRAAEAVSRCMIAWGVRPENARVEGIARELAGHFATALESQARRIKELEAERERSQTLDIDGLDTAKYHIENLRSDLRFAQQAAFEFQRQHSALVKLIENVEGMARVINRARYPADREPRELADEDRSSQEYANRLSKAVRDHLLTSDTDETTLTSR